MKLFHQAQSVKREFFTTLLIFVAITAIFFYQTIIKGYIPFPGDLLVGHYEPYKSYEILGFAPGGVPNKAQGPDVIKELFPWKYFASQQLKNSEIPFWDPYNFSGNPLLANFQSAVFYPLNVLFLVLPFIPAWTVFIFLTPLLSGFFTFLFLRQLSLSKPASLFGGVVFAFSSYMVVWLEYGNIGHTFLWLPLALFYTEKFIQKFKVKQLFPLVLVLFASLLGGYIQGLFYMLVIISIYFLFKIGKDKRAKKLLFFFGALSFPIFLSLFQLLPTIELFQYATRGNYSLLDIQKLLNPFWYLITLVAPDFFGNPATRNYFFPGTYIERVSYIGVIPIILAIGTSFLFRKRKEIVIFTILAVFTLLITTDIFITKYFYLLPIPMISTAVPTRMLSMFVFCTSILAAFGFDLLLKKTGKKAFFIATGIIGIILLVAWMFAIWGPASFTKQQWAIAKHNLYAPTALTLFFAIFILMYFRSKAKQVFIVALFLLTIFDLFRFFDKITPFSPKEFVYPQTPIVSFLSEQGINRFWGYGSGYIGSNFQTFDKTYSPEGNDPLHIKSYTEFLETSKNGEIPNVLPRPDANVAPGFGSTDLEENAYRQKILNILGVKYLLRKDEPSKENNTYKLVWKEGAWQIYENLLAVPRIFVTSDYIVETGAKETFNKLFAKDFDEKKTLILSEDPHIAKEDYQGKVELLHYNPNAISLTTSSGRDGLLFLSDNYYPGWQASVDEKRTKIYLADHTFRAVVVPKGDHRVEFSYQPESFQKGFYLSMLSFFVLIGVFLKFRKYEIT